MKTRALLILSAALVVLLALPILARSPEPVNVYAARRAKLSSQLDAPLVLFGYTGREDSSPSAFFNQEPNFYYLTGHNEPGAALVVVPEKLNDKPWDGPREIFFLPPRNPQQERWEGPKMGAEDPGVAEKTGFAVVEPFASLRTELEKLAKSFPSFYTLLPPSASQDVGYPHARNWTTWLQQIFPQMQLRDAAGRIGALRQIKSPGEIELLTRAVDLSLDAHLEAMKMLRPGLFEYQVAARMEYVHAYGGCEREGYAPIVGTGFNSTVLHYSRLTAQIKPGDVVVMDVACEYSGYSADITRTFPADGKFTPRQREIYEIVLGAQNAVLAEIKPGRTMGRGPNGLFQVAYDYINTHGKDRQGRTLGRYFIHGLGHHIGLLVHDAGDPNRPLEPGMIVTVEPGIYIPEESLGVRIEDDVLITETGYKLLSARLPRTVEEIERIMADARKSPPH